MATKPEGLTNQKTPSIPELKRQLLFVPCETKAHLHRWIKVYLDLDMPTDIVCDDDLRHPPSNSSPLDLIWEIYSKALEGYDAKFTNILYFAARDSFKTLSAAVLEVLALVHLNRDVAHLAALEVQAKNCQNYVEKFLKKPVLRDFLTSKNKREIIFTKYIDKEGNIISPVEYDALDPQAKNHYLEHSNWVKIVICTVEAANGLHSPLLICDEVDIADAAALEEAKMIPTPTQDGKLPITIYTSTRKYAFGLVQKEIDRAAETDLHIRHWNLIDITKACPPERHLPDDPKIPIYYSENTLKAVSKDDWMLLGEKEKEQYDVKEGYAGCLSNCKMFASCLGRLALKQTSKSSLLKSVDHTQATMRKVSVEHAKAQYLCWKPSSEGLIYPNFSKEIHMLSPAQMAHKITGDEFPEHFSKSQLIDLMKQFGATFHAGMDHGYTHHFAVVTAALIGHVLYIIDVIAVDHFELIPKINLCKERIKHFNPTIYPDNAYPSDNKTFKRNGFRMIDFKKDIMLGIESIRGRIMPGAGLDPSLYLLKGDPGCELLAGKIMRLHWKLDAAGVLTDEIDSDIGTDESDALRYLGQNVPLNKSKVHISFGFTEETPDYNPNKNWMKNKINELTGESDGDSVEVKGKAGGFLFSI